MIKAEKRKVGREEGTMVTIDGNGREIRTELVAIMLELLEGGFPEEWMRIAVEVAIDAREHRDEWEIFDAGKKEDENNWPSVSELMKILDEMKRKSK